MVEPELQEERCDCGNLLCKFLKDDYIEIKCRRCRRLFVIPIKRLKEKMEFLKDCGYEYNTITDNRREELVVERFRLRSIR